jgi:hypothetical protein
MQGSMNIKLQVISRIGWQQDVYSWTYDFHGWGMAYNKWEGEQLAWQVDILKIPMQFMKFQSHCPLYSEWTQYCGFHIFEAPVNCILLILIQLCMALME